MSTDTSSALDQPTATAATPKTPRDKVMRIATMTRQLLDEVHTQTLDAASRDRLRTIDTHIIDELLTDLAPGGPGCVKVNRPHCEGSWPQR